MNFEQNLQIPDMTTRTVIDRFNDAFNRHDPELLNTLLTDDTVFEDTSPAPDGKRVEGKPAVLAFWREWFLRNPEARFEVEEIIVSGDRAVGAGLIARSATDSRGICAAWTFSRYATEKWPRSSHT